MVSIYELAEYLRIIGGEATTAELKKVFGMHDVIKAARYLKAMGWVELIVKPLGKGAKYTYIVRLTPYAYHLLRKYNVESFYDLPFAKARREWLKKVVGRDFINFSYLK